MKVRIYTDGACSCNPGPGGWSYLVSAKEKIIIRSGGENNTTNNRMELLAVVKSLQKMLKKWKTINKHNDFNEIEILSDSAYVVNAVNMNWLQSWKQKKWKTSNNEDVKNVDLWKQLDELFYNFKKMHIIISFTKVKGHAGNTFNEMCDEAARKEVQKIKGEC